MRILFLIPDLTGRSGWSRYGLDLGKALAARGHEMHALVAKKTDASWCTQHALLRDPMTYLQGGILRWMGTKRVSGAIRKIRPDVIHIIAEPYALLLSDDDLKQSWMTIHGTYSTAPFRFSAITARRFSRAYRLLKGVISVSEFTKRHVREDAGSLWDEASLNDKIRVVPNAVDLTDVAKEERRTSDRGKVILSVSAIKKKKGYLQSLEAIRLFHAMHPDVALRYDIVGSLAVDKGFAEELKSAIGAAGLEKIVNLRGSISEEELRDAYLSADVFLLPSLPDDVYFEGFGLVFLEANTYGTPVIGPTSGGCPEAIENGKSGYVVDPLDAGAIAHALEKILIDHTIRSDNCRAWARKHDIVKSAETIERLYRQN